MAQDYQENNGATAQTETPSVQESDARMVDFSDYQPKVRNAVDNAVSMATDLPATTVASKAGADIAKRGIDKLNARKSGGVQRAIEGGERMVDFSDYNPTEEQKRRIMDAMSQGYDTRKYKMNPNYRRSGEQTLQWRERLRKEEPMERTTQQWMMRKDGEPVPFHEGGKPEGWDNFTPEQQQKYLDNMRNAIEREQQSENVYGRRIVDELRKAKRYRSSK